MQRDPILLPAGNSRAEIALFIFAQIAPSQPARKSPKPTLLLEILYLEESTYPHIAIQHKLPFAIVDAHKCEVYSDFAAIFRPRRLSRPPVRRP